MLIRNAYADFPSRVFLALNDVSQRELDRYGQAMEERYIANIQGLLDWFEGLEVPDLDAPLPKELLRSQAVLALLAIIRLGEGNAGFANGFTWIHPYCHP